MEHLNRLDLAWTCPLCDLKQNGSVSFPYGRCYRYIFRMGDSVDWNREGVIETERFPEGTGEISLRIECKGHWGARWFAENRGSNKPMPTGDERLRYGCVGVMTIVIQLTRDRISGFRFPQDRFELLAPPEPFNFLAAAWDCPFCKISYSSITSPYITFAYGPYDEAARWTLKYRVGDKIDWSQPNPLGKRLSNVSGVISGKAFCVNHWMNHWYGSAHWRDVPIEVRRRYGCPTYIPIEIQIDEDRLEKVHFAGDIREKARWEGRQWHWALGAHLLTPAGAFMAALSLGICSHAFCATSPDKSEVLRRPDYGFRLRYPARYHLVEHGPDSYERQLSSGVAISGTQFPLRNSFTIGDNKGPLLIIDVPDTSYDSPVLTDYDWNMRLCGQSGFATIRSEDKIIHAGQKTLRLVSIPDYSSEKPPQPVNYYCINHPSQPLVVYYPDKRAALSREILLGLRFIDP